MTLSSRQLTPSEQAALLRLARELRSTDPVFAGEMATSVRRLRVARLRRGLSRAAGYVAEGFIGSGLMLTSAPAHVLHARRASTTRAEHRP